MSRGRPSATAPAPAPALCTYAQHSDVDVPSSPAGELYAQPSDVTLVKDFLRPWVTSGDTKSGGGAYVHAADLYSADPEELARRFQPAVSMDGDQIWYFLSPLRTRSPRDRRKVRAVADGTGCWHSEAAPKNVVDYVDGGGRRVGYRQSFSFMRRRNSGADARTGWIMAEFHLHNHDEHGPGNKVEGLVLCKMYRSPRNHGPAAPPLDADNRGPATPPLDAGNRGPAAPPPLVGDHDVVSSMSLSAETTDSAETTSSCEKSKAVDDDEDSNAATPTWQRQAAMAAPLLRNKAAGYDEVSGVTTPLCAKNKAVAADDDDEDLLESLPARKKMRVAVADAERSGVELALEAAAADVAAQLHYCPQCGYHLAALQALVTLAKSKKMQEME